MQKSVIIMRMDNHLSACPTVKEELLVRLAL